jgi:hypothetical protein
MNLDTLLTETRASRDFCKGHFQKPVELMGQIQYLELEEWSFKLCRSEQYDFDHLPGTILKHLKALKELTFVPTHFGLWEEKDLVGENGQLFMKGYEEFFKNLAAEDPTHTIPKIIIDTSNLHGHSMCKWIYEK